MPLTKKLSYAKSRERRNKTIRSSLINDINHSGSLRSSEAIISQESQQVQYISDDSVGTDVRSDIERKKREKIRDRILDVGQELEDMCINAFIKVLSANTPFEPQDPLFYQGLHWYERVTAAKDIQILYGGDIGADEIGHWTCVYYDGSVVHVYDTLHRKLLPLQYDILKRLYGEYSIVHENVQRQPDGVSCGVFACAIAVSLAQGTDPTTVRYFVDEHGENGKCTLTMRRHLCKILEQETLIQFPTAVRTTSHVGQQGSGVTLIGKKSQGGVGSAMQLPSQTTYASV